MKSKDTPTGEPGTKREAKLCSGAELRHLIEKWLTDNSGERLRELQTHCSGIRSRRLLRLRLDEGASLKWRDILEDVAGESEENDLRWETATKGGIKILHGYEEAMGEMEKSLVRPYLVGDQLYIEIIDP